MSLIRDKRIFESPGGDPTLPGRVTTLENNEIKVLYFESVGTATGTLSIPSGATILLGQFESGIDALTSTIVSGQPTGNSPQTGGGTTISVSSFDTLGNYTLSGTPSAFPVAILYILKIDFKDWANLTTANIVEYEQVGKLTTNLTNTHIWVGNAANIATDVAASGDLTLANTGAFTLNTVNGNVGTFGSATQSTQFTVNAKGLITAVANITVTPAVGSITGLGTGIATWLATPSSANLRAAITDENGTGALLFNGATSPDFTTGFTIGTAAASGKFIVGNGTNYVPSTSTIPTSAGTSGKILISDGTNYVLSTPTFPNTSATSGKMIMSDGTNWVASTPTWPSAAPGAGTFLRGDGTNWTTSTNTLPNTTAANLIWYATGTNAIGTSTNFGYNGTTLYIGNTGPTKAAQVEVNGQLNINTPLGGTSISFSASATSNYKALLNLAATTADLVWFRATGTNGSEAFSETVRVLNTNGDVGIGTGATISARLHLTKTTEQLRIGYDASNYASLTTSSVGNLTFAVTGTSPVFIFNQNVTLNADLKINNAGNGIYVKEGTNATMGTTTLVGGTKVVNTTKVTANSRIFLQVDTLGTVAVAKAVAVTARTAGTSFTITSSDGTDTSVVSWIIIEPS